MAPVNPSLIVLQIMTDALDLGKMLFYQSIDLPRHGLMKGCWDHRPSMDVYLGGTNFENATALDVGPASGFWSFEMERRGACVTALELGPNDHWDAVPHLGKPTTELDKQLAMNVERTKNAFIFSREALESKVKLVHGTVYNVDKVIPRIDIALMGNVLQHFRDPFLAIETVSRIVTKRIIISETLWMGDQQFLDQAALRLIPRAEHPEVNHSWWQVSPPLIGEILKILGYINLKCEYHEQLFIHSATDNAERQVKHFTYSADKPN